MPEWAVGVIAILGGVGVLSVVVRLGDLLIRRASALGHGGEGRGPHTVIGMHVGTGSASGGHAETLEDLQRRVAELEERLDFAERILARQRDAERLIPPAP